MAARADPATSGLPPAASAATYRFHGSCANVWSPHRVLKAGPETERKEELVAIRASNTSDTSGGRERAAHERARSTATTSGTAQTTLLRLRQRVIHVVTKPRA